MSDATGRKATPRKAAAKPAAAPAPAEPAAVEPAAVELRAVPEPAPRDLPDGAVEVPFLDKGTVVVLDPEDWPSSANEALLNRMFNTWATKVLATEDDVALWLNTDPTRRQVDQFFAEYNRITGLVTADPKQTRRAMLHIAQ
jgi:hypothetical protein